MLQTEVTYTTFYDQGVSLIALYTSLLHQSTTLEDKSFWQRHIRLTSAELEAVAPDDRHTQSTLYHRWQPLEEQLNQVRSMF
ncbi:hypothetical protein [Micrococcoides hystricis]|uniref:Uncharacterized protein n=1 Tax=Micrococcoides hystricis TaxID=1572761 RepID=A0ABV6PAB3_9MICC